jgi:hypothetical protein
MKMHLRVTNGDGSTADVMVSAVDLVAFEGKFDKSVTRFQEDFRMTDIYWLAWHTIQRKDKSVGDFEQWLETHEPEVEFGGDSGEIVPLENSPQHGTSST